VTEHQVLQVQCACGKVQRGEFPQDVSAPVQYGPHAQAAIVHADETGLLTLFTGTLIHDGRAPYRLLDKCKHGLCTAHHLRELTYVHQQLGQGWAKKMD
jgi:hypothetical protein